MTAIVRDLDLDALVLKQATGRSPSATDDLNHGGQMSTVEQSIAAFRSAAVEDRRQADELEKLFVKDLSNAVNDKIEVLAEYHRKRAEVAEWCAGQLEKKAGKKVRVVS